MGKIKQTAVEWLESELKEFKKAGDMYQFCIGITELRELISEAKKIESVQLSNANNGNYCAVCGSTEFWYDEDLDSSIVKDDEYEDDDE